MEWPVSRVRQEFVTFFEQRCHTFVPSSSVVPHDDPTLLFANAGMNQFKNIFLGAADPNTDFGRLTRAVNSQMCIRAGGKHNDLDDVGRDTYHHTFFEMLGSWSFGDYFKREAIKWAWELLTEVFKIPKEQLYVTYFEGDKLNGMEADEEAKEVWLELLPPNHVIPGNTKDNFWEMGDIGPCGPCSEIHYDRIGNRDASAFVNKDDPMVIEVWNLVFMQFERRTDGQMVKLPKAHVDTGMGLERLTSILQGVHSNYDTDAWTPLFDAIQKVTGFDKSYTEIRSDDRCDATVAYRAVADHIRCLTVALADGAMPDSVGRGFVLRRIIRRAVRYGVQFLGAKVGFFSQLVDAVVASLGPFFKHLQEPRTVHRIKTVIADEEASFAKTWETGLKHFNKAVAEAVNSTISGEHAFILHDRYGFPVDLTNLLAEKANMHVDMEGFHATMKASQLSAGRVAAAKTFIDVHQLEELKNNDVKPTDDSAKYVWKDCTAEVKAILNKKTGEFTDMLLPDATSGPEDIGIVLDVTNFYAESGGQIYDTGLIVAAPDAVFEVRKVYNVGGFVVHVGNMLRNGYTAPTPIPVSCSVELRVDYERRLPIAANHTSTHLLNWCLRRVLEEEAPGNFMEIQQKGSLVTDEMLRFDFSYNNKVPQEDLIKVEKLLNQKINEGLQVYRKEVPLSLARRVKGLRQMFGEKYPDPVSVISLGAPVEELIADPEKEEWGSYSVEFCGGTHLSNLQDAQVAVIISEESLMKGVRRMVVMTRDAARKALFEGESLRKELQEILSLPTSDATVKRLSVLNKKVGDSAIPLIVKNSLRDEVDGCIRSAITSLKAMATQLKEKATAAGRDAGERHDASLEPLLVQVVPENDADRELLQAYADGFCSSVKGDVGLFLVGADANKALALVLLPSAFVAKKLDAVSWAKAAVGKGGGKPHLAQSGFAAGIVETVLEKAKSEAEKMKKIL
ncbi:tRNA synthetases class II (A) Threonyl and Alanyl tRNA synthetase second additional domain [Trypanosoma vivax]|uniref:Alanine--tRNA ligase n=1 Tax=Trypanosoma vivax (strain Y486) TaxID=1055687 RepID=G0TW92_TRYVY|nr:tRNA synthetases class II (A) Threonyl and Alanyl tRNA synthetase second additional domain [Trypanosoma vivax]CCC48230.1 putative alanyl-tRNA synthetase [Trypanosoma vivax Y486]